MTATNALPTPAATSLGRGDSPIKVFRLAAGISIATMASQTRLDVGRIEAIEAGDVATDGELMQIAKAIKIPFDLIGL